MKKLICLVLAILLLSGCGTQAVAPVQDNASPAAETAAPDEIIETPEPVEIVPEAVPNVVDDGRARPSGTGQLQVLNGKLCGEDGTPAMLRGVSSYGLPMGESFINEPLFGELAKDMGANVFRMAMYTWGVGSVGYCTGGDKERLKQDIRDGVNYAKMRDLYAIVDWHILQDGDPNTYIDEAKAFFSEMAEEFRDCNNILYEICNEPNGVEWADIKKYAEEIIPIIREHDPDSVIIVGTPNWSQRLDEAAADPLEFDNILYTLHFYSATHKEELRSIARAASQSGFPIFVTEFGVTAASGGHPRDLDEADVWIDFLEEEGISYCMWSFSKVPEPCSAIVSSCPKYNGFDADDFTLTGKWLVETLQNRK